jgi:hypothetical protein
MALFEGSALQPGSASKVAGCSNSIPLRPLRAYVFEELGAASQGQPFHFCLCRLLHMAITSSSTTYLYGWLIHAALLLLLLSVCPCCSWLCRQGAVQFAFGPPAETGGKSYAIETRLPPVAMGGPSVEELQEGMIQLVPGTYQIVFDQE